MATTTKIIHKTGAKGDYTTVASWEAGIGSLGSSAIYLGVICDNAEYNESAVSLATTGNGAADSYIRLTANDGTLVTTLSDTSAAVDVRHDGTTGSGARIR